VSDIVDSAKEEFKKDSEYWEDIYRKAREDLYFLSDAPDAQWSKDDLKARQRSGRPVLTIDQLGQYVNQVVNDIRKNTPSIEVIPDVDGAIEEADVQQDIIRDILYNSEADTCFDVAAAYAVKSSFGFIRVDTSYVSDRSFDQQLKVYTVHDPATCFLDSDSQSITGDDAKHCFILDCISKDAFEEEHPGKKAVSFCSDANIKSAAKDDIVIAEYFKIKVKEKKIGVTIDGLIEEVQDGVEYTKERKVEVKTIKRYLLSGEEVLESTEFVGENLPLVPVFGNQMWIDGDREIHSLIRKSKDAQRMFNYWKSLETELLQKQPRATFMYAAGQIEDFAEAWEDPDKSPALPYKPTDVAGNPVPPPQRLDPPMIPAGIVNAARSASEDIKSTIGMYAASLGQESNEVSGVAIQRRNEEGDTATYHFSDNLNKSIARVGKILRDAIPYVYDTPRFVSTIGKEEDAKVVGINGAMAQDQKQTFNLKAAGGYKTKVITGASYTTQRQEAANFFNNVVVKNPELMSVMGDLLFKNMDFAGSEAMSERMKKYIDPQYQDDEEEEYDPEKEQMTSVIEEGQKLIGEQQDQIDGLLAELKDKDSELEIKAESEDNKKQADEDKYNIDLMKLRADKEKADKEHQFKMAALELKQRELGIKEMKERRDVEIQVNQTNEQPENVELDIETPN